MQYSVRLKDELTRKALFAIAEEAGLTICDYYRDLSVREVPYFIFKPLEAKVVGGFGGYDPVNPISVDEMAQRLEKHEIMWVKLNDSYTAEILPEEKVVKVGCQKIPFSKVVELYKAISEIRG